MIYKVLAYYLYTDLSDPHGEVERHHAFFEGRDAKARVYISEQGINGQMSASEADAEAYIEWMNHRPEFAGIEFKLTDYHEHVFPRLTIKYRKELVALGMPIDLSKRGEHISAECWKQMLEETPDRVVLDVRNDYEYLVGHFEGAIPPPCSDFRDFPEYADKLKERVDPKKTPVMMYCTGGIRCEIFSAMLLKAGFEKVYQLQGGVIKYGQKVGSDHWKGKLFVFDDRLTAPLDDKDTGVVGKCHHCGAPSEAYYNCANMDCNRLYLCCQDCLKELAGCCQTSCKESPRRRPYSHQNAHKPFRKWYHYAKRKEDLASLSQV